MAEATFPTQEEQVLPPQEHVIRLITRLLFVWFLKEKGLVADDLFNETKIAALLNNYERDRGDVYYRAVLQNLFFATLNTEMDRRGFSTTKHSTHRNFSLYRYQSAINDPDTLVACSRRRPLSTVACSTAWTARRACARAATGLTVFPTTRGIPPS